MHKSFSRTTGIALSIFLLGAGISSFDLFAQAASQKRESKKNAQAETMPKEFKKGAKSGILRPADTILHPLDPLTKEELQASVNLLKAEGKFGNRVSLVSLTSQEPSKETVLAFKAGMPIMRESIAVLYNIDTNETHEVVCDLNNMKVVCDKHQKGEQPMQLEEDTPIGMELLAKDPAWMHGLERRGIKDMANIHMEMFVVGNPIFINNPDKDRLLRAYPYYRVVGNNSFGEPIEGLSAIINVTKKKVTVRDSRDIIPLAGVTSNYFDAQNVGKLRTPAKPLITTQPDGPSFTIDGHEVSWQKWRFRYELDSREGLVIHCVDYNDDGRIRTVLHRANVSEVSVPYGAPGLDWAWRSPIDEGEYGLGRLTTTLRPGHEVPSYAKIIEEPYADSAGKVHIKPGALAIWEQDGGILWEHHDDDANRTSTRRSRQLVIAHMFTLGNYDYFTQWIFSQDGSIDVKTTLNGDVLTQGVSMKECQVCSQEPDEEGVIIPKGAERYGTLMAPNIVGINHQHFFCFRLDFDVDGVKNNLYELNVRPLGESRGHLEQNTFAVERTLLKREEDAARDLNEVQSRCWKVVNKNAPRYLGHPPGYVIAPGGNAYPYSHPDSYNRKRAGFLRHHFWATQYKYDEVYAAGDYPTSSKGGQGLPEWVGEESIDNEDLVVWYTVGVTHAPRVEDWPVMPSTTMGFKIMPDSFFKRNPALDLEEANTPMTDDPNKIPKESQREEAGMR